MGKRAFANYGKATAASDNTTILSGRYLCQEQAERRVLQDVADKLRLQPDDDVLDIGCGVGNLTIPMSFLVRSVTGIDQEQVISRVRSRIGRLSTDMRLVEGNFLDLQLDAVGNGFSKVLAYSVIQLLSDRREVLEMIDKGLRLLKPGGRFLIGDIGNTERQTRILNSPAGAHWQARFDEARREQESKGLEFGISDLIPIHERDSEFVNIDDDFVMQIMLRYRRQGYETYLVEQAPDLPYGIYREDLIIVASD